MADLIIKEEMLSMGDGDLSVFLRNKRRADAPTGRADRTVLFVHGATYTSTVTFDFPADGKSWMDFLAEAGFDCWLMDIRGYGRSERPPEMSVPAEENDPIVHTTDAIDDLGRVVDHILAHRNISSLQLLGYSWGTLITGAYTAAHNDKVERLALYGTSMLNSSASLIGTEKPQSSYRLVTAEAAKERWRHGLSPEQIDDIIEPDWQQAWLDAAIASDPEAGNHSPPQLRAPTGVVDDKVSRWAQGIAPYDPARITVPVLIAIGEHDIETPPEGGMNVYRMLTAAPHRQFTLIGRTTHSAFVERRRKQLFEIVETFLTRDFR